MRKLFAFATFALLLVLPTSTSIQAHPGRTDSIMAVIHAGQIVRNGDWLMANITVTMVEVRVPQVEHQHHQRVDPQHHLQVHRNLFRRQNQRLKFRHSRKLIMQKKGLRMDIRSK